PITSTHDILNAFDGITYSKGGAVLAMFERYLGAEVFQKGVQQYLAAHAFANATSEDFLDAESAAAGKDVRTPFFTFLTQVGVPLVKASVNCEPNAAHLELEQSRYLPLGSKGAAASAGQLWQIPVCARYASGGSIHETCTLLTEAKGKLPFDGGACPSWVMPNADAAGYYRFTLPPADLDKLRSAGWKQLTPRERVSIAEALHAGFASGTLDAKSVFDAFPALIADDDRDVVEVPMQLLRFAHDELVTEAQRPAVEARARKLYEVKQGRLGFHERPGEDGETKLLRASLLSFVADVGRDPAVRKRAQSQGKRYLGLGAGDKLHPEAVDSDLADLAVRMVAEDGDDATWDTLYKRFVATTEPALRARLLRALCSVRDARSSKALALALDPALHVNEVLVPLYVQVGDPRTRDAAWQWLEQNFDALTARLSSNGAGHTPGLAASFCREDMIGRAQTFFGPRVEKLSGGPRSLADAIESLEICVAQVKAHGPGVQALFP
ncbi:MAG TPA: M1 family metallopeptidase, partial [Polyangiales bacterium]|nr:M1 family metallopeptidase [Polyangiales bacterium]